MSATAVAFVSVADVIKDVVNGQEVIEVVFHKPRPERIVPANFFPPGTDLATANDRRSELEKPVPMEMLDVGIDWETALKYLSYDEQCGRTVDFTLWTRDWVVRHVWIGAGGPVVGGKVLRLMRLPRNPGGQDKP